MRLVRRPRPECDDFDTKQSTAEKALESLPANATIHIHVEDVSFIDHACLDLLTNWKQQHQKLGGQLILDWESLTARSTAR